MCSTGNAQRGDHLWPQEVNCHIWPCLAAPCKSVTLLTHTHCPSLCCKARHMESLWFTMVRPHMAVSSGWLWDRPEKYPCVESSESECERPLGRALTDMYWKGGAWSRGSVAARWGSSGSFFISSVESVVMLLPASCMLEPRRDDSSGCRLDAPLQRTALHGTTKLAGKVSL